MRELQSHGDTKSEQSRETSEEHRGETGAYEGCSEGEYPWERSLGSHLVAGLHKLWDQQRAEKKILWDLMMISTKKSRGLKKVACHMDLTATQNANCVAAWKRGRVPQHFIWL